MCCNPLKKNSDATNTYLTADRDKKHVTSKRVILNRDTDVWTLEVLSAHTPCAYHVRSMFGRYLSVEHDGTVRADTRRPGDRCAIVFVPAAAAVPPAPAPAPAPAQPVPTPGAYPPPPYPQQQQPWGAPQGVPQGVPQPYPAPAPVPAQQPPRGLPPMPSPEYADAFAPMPPPYGAQQQQQQQQQQTCPPQQQQSVYGMAWDTPAPPYYPQ